MRPIVLDILLVLTLSPAAPCQWTVAVGDLDEDGLPDRVVARHDHLSVLGGQVDGSLESLGELPVGDFPWLWLADLDGDGHLDLVAVHAGIDADAAVGWAFGTGQGSFGPLAWLEGAGTLRTAELADLDGDGSLDLAALDGLHPIFSEPADVVVFRGQGASGFAPPLALFATDAGASLEVADVSGDGALDLVVGRLAFSGSLAPVVETWLADGAGGYVAGPLFPATGALGVPAVGDVDGDAVLDLAVISASDLQQPSEVTVHRGLGGGVFAPGRAVSGLSPSASRLQLADLDADGRDDLLAGYLSFDGNELGANRLVVLRSERAGTFARWQEIPGTEGGLLSDLDLDADLDLVDGATGVTIPGVGDGLLGVPPSIAVGDRPSDAQAAFVDADALLDLVVLEESGTRVRLLRGLPRARLQLLGLVEPGFEVTLLRVGDLDGDGLSDLVLGGAQVVALRNDGAGGFGPPTVLDFGLSASTTLADLRLVDIEGDGVRDVMALLYGDAPPHGTFELKLAAGLGDGTFGPSASSLGGCWSIADGDLDGDGRTDLVTLSLEADQLRLRTLLGTGDGGFVLASDLVPVLGATFAVADLDGDGVQDVLLSSGSSDAFYRGVGDGTMHAPVALTLPPVDLFAEGVRLADADDDGVVDLLLPASLQPAHPAAAAIVPGLGDGTFGEPLALQAGSLPVASAVGDWNHDGLTDLVLANRGSDDVSVLLQPGGPSLWTDLGSPLAGVAGEPRLVAGGTLTAGAPTTLVQTRAAPGALGFLLLGERLAGGPFAGGVLWPQPEAVVPFVTDVGGAWSVTARWPDGLPSGGELHVQAWILDASGPSGLAASNGLTATVP